MEEGKIDINKSNPLVFRNLLMQWGIEQETIDTIVDSVADWRDGDKMHRANGAEDDYYNSLDPPYNAANGDFTSVEELLRVKGITPDLLYRTKPPAEDDADTEERNKDLPVPRLIDCLTVFNEGGRINVSSALPEVLASIPFMSPALANRILELREDVGEHNLTTNDVREALGSDIYSGIQSYIKVGGISSKGGYYALTSEAELENGFVLKIKAVANIKGTGNKPVTIIQWMDWVT